MIESNNFTNRNYFEILGLPISQSQDIKVIENSRINLLKKYHPDNSCTKNKEYYNHCSMKINEAYHNIRTPISRAYYICCMYLSKDYNVKDQESFSDVGFLQELIVMREKFDSCVSNQERESILNHILYKLKLILEDITRKIDEEKKYELALVLIKKYLFYQKFVNTYREQN